jgi:hypothetical protein
MTRVAGLVVVGVGLLVGPAAAQNGRVGEGEHIRVWTETTRMVYPLASLTPESLVVAGPNGLVEIPRSTIRSVQVRQRRGRGAQVGRDALSLGLIGAAGGAVVGYLDGDDTACNWSLCWSASDKAMVGGLAFGVGGAAVGAVVGAVRRPGMIWRRVPLHQLHLAAAPGGGGAAVGVSLRH